MKAKVPHCYLVYRIEVLHQTAHYNLRPTPPSSREHDLHHEPDATHTSLSVSRSARRHPPAHQPWRGRPGGTRPDLAVPRQTLPALNGQGIVARLESRRQRLTTGC